MDVNSILNSVMGSGGTQLDKVAKKAKSGSKGSGMLGGAAAGGLVALLLSNKKARKMGKKALKYGGVAAVGGLAYKAWNDHQGQKNVQQVTPMDTHQSEAPAAPKQIAAAPVGSIFDLAQEQISHNGEDMRLVIVRAMISAAKSDGHIDAQERARIEEQIQVLEIGQEEQRFLVEQLNAPSDPIAIAKLASGPEQASEIYAASTLAVDIDTQEERRYLERLGDALHLPDALRTRLEAETSGY